MLVAFWFAYSGVVDFAGTGCKYMLRRHGGVESWDGWGISCRGCTCMVGVVRGWVCITLV